MRGVLFEFVKVPPHEPLLHVSASPISFFLVISEAHQLSALLLETMETLRSPLCSSWATLHVWFHVTKHYVSAVKEITEGNVRISKLFLMFGGGF